MPDLSPAETLIAAASLLRDRSAAVQIASPLPWRAADLEDAQLLWIALMHPGVGLALADWLELEADLLEALPADNAEALKTVPARLVLQSCRHALAVARQILGGVA